MRDGAKKQEALSLEAPYFYWILILILIRKLSLCCINPKKSGPRVTRSPGLVLSVFLGVRGPNKKKKGRPLAMSVHSAALVRRLSTGRSVARD